MNRKAFLQRKINAGFKNVYTSTDGTITPEGVIASQYFEITIFGRTTQGENPTAVAPKDFYGLGTYNNESGVYELPISLQTNNGTFNTNIDLKQAPLFALTAGEKVVYDKLLITPLSVKALYSNVNVKLTLNTLASVDVDTDTVTFDISSYAAPVAGDFTGYGTHTSVVTNTAALGASGIGISEGVATWKGILGELGLSTEEEFRAWLSSQNVCVIYPSETVSVATLAPLSFTLENGKNVFFIDSGDGYIYLADEDGNVLCTEDGDSLVLEEVLAIEGIKMELVCRSRDLQRS